MKKKMAVLIGIAVCAILLASPALASAGYSKIYGNANEDDVLDMRDVTYIKLVIFGKKPATTFADANYDGKISMLDIGQTKLIILGKEKQLTLVDMADRTVTINKPVARVVCAGILEGPRVLVQLGATDKIMATNYYVKERIFGQDRWDQLRYAAPELAELPSVGAYTDPNKELIVSLNPDVVFAYSRDIANAIQESTGVPTVCMKSVANLDFSVYRFAGTILGKEKEAEELISYANEKIAEITEITSEIPDSEKPKVYFAMWTSGGKITRTRNRYDPVDLAGGINVVKGCAPVSDKYTVEVSKEQIILWNPDIILVHGVFPPHKVSVEDVLSDPDLQTINAVKNKQVYYMKDFQVGFDRATGVTETFYLAKLIHPDKFKDLDVEEECNEIFKKFYRVDSLYSDMLEKSDLYRWE